MPRPLPLLLVSMLAGCSAAHLAAKKGQTAFENGDYEGALGHYWSACRQSNDAEWCAVSDRLYEQLLPTVVAEASPRCGQAGSERACFDSLSRLRRFKDDPRLSSLADASGRTWLEACRKTSVSSPVGAVVRVRCVEAVRRDVMTPAYERQVTEERTAMAAFVASESQTASTRGYVASSYGLAELGQCFSGERPVRLEELRSAATRQLQLGASVAADGLVGASWVCERLASESGGRIVCGASSAVLGVRVELERGQLTHAVSDSEQTVSYVAERQQYLNPEWHRLEVVRERAERRERQARQQAKLAADECENARHDRARAGHCIDCEAERVERRTCKYAETLAGFRAEAARALDDAESCLRRTDRTLVREIMADYRSVERTHLWQQPYRLSIAAQGPVLRAQDAAFQVKRGGVERAEFEPAGISGSVATPPTQASLDQEAVAHLSNELAGWVKDAQAVYARAREVECASQSGNLAAHFECRASVAYLRGEDAARAYVAMLGKAADQAAPFPAASCAR